MINDEESADDSQKQSSSGNQETDTKNDPSLRVGIEIPYVKKLYTECRDEIPVPFFLSCVVY